MTEDHPRYNLKNTCPRLQTGAEHYKHVCNLYTLVLLQVQSITDMGKLIRLLFNVGENSHSKMQQFIDILQSLTQARTLTMCAQS